MIEFRKATAEDINALAKVRIDFLCEANQLTEEEKEVLLTANRQYFTETMADGSFIAWIALDGADIAGTSGITFYKVPPNASCPTGKTAYISNMFTYPRFRKQGIAFRLFSLIVDEAKINGYKKVLLNATDMGKPLYARYGFQDTAGDMIYYIK